VGVRAADLLAVVRVDDLAVCVLHLDRHDRAARVARAQEVVEDLARRLVQPALQVLERDLRLDAEARHEQGGIRGVVDRALADLPFDGVAEHDAE
jgi:hypothetical protein